MSTVKSSQLSEKVKFSDRGFCETKIQSKYFCLDTTIHHFHLVRFLEFGCDVKNATPVTATDEYALLAPFQLRRLFDSLDVDESVTRKHIYKRNWVPFDRPRVVSEDSIPLSIESSNWSSLTSPHWPSGPLEQINDCSPNYKTPTSPTCLYCSTHTTLTERGLSDEVVDKSEQEDSGGHLSQAQVPANDSGESPALDINYVKEIELIQYLGGGSAASVYKGVWNSHTVAVKLFHELGESEDARFAFSQELSVLSSLHHKNIVKVLAASTTPPNLCIIQELAPQGTLFDMLHDHRVRPQYGKLLQILTEITRAMNYCHSRTTPVIHRDLKTKNVLLNETGEVAYSAPELFRNEGVTEKCDVYSFGVIAWECLTGEKPWDGMLPMQVVMAVSVEKRHLKIPRNCPRDLESVNTKSASSDLVVINRKLLLSCFQQDPQLRPGFTQVKKTGAGFLITSCNEVLLLLRSASSGNPNTWGLPGGNMDKDETPIDAALREATEELGKPIPNHVIKAEIRTIRGKNLDKLFTVFVVEISPTDKVSFQPELNKEHVEFKWYALDAVLGIKNLHPVVEILFKDHSRELNKAFGV
eukprot:g1274.t1